jgi:UDP-glucose 4-epimerase
MKLCVTGAAGYVGSVVAELLVGRGHDVVVLDNLTTGHRDAVPSGCRLVAGDIRDERALAEALDGGVEAVLHFAALSVVAQSMRTPLDYFDNNVSGTTRLVRAMEARKIGSWCFHPRLRCMERRRHFPSTKARRPVRRIRTAGPS